MDWITSPESWIALLTLTALEIVLGIDNIIFISILAGKLPEDQQKTGRQAGLLLAEGIPKRVEKTVGIGSGQRYDELITVLDQRSLSLFLVEVQNHLLQRKRFECAARARIRGRRRLHVHTGLRPKARAGYPAGYRVSARL